MAESELNDFSPSNKTNSSNILTMLDATKIIRSIFLKEEKSKRDIDFL